MIKISFHFHECDFGKPHLKQKSNPSICTTFRYYVANLMEINPISPKKRIRGFNALVSIQYHTFLCVTKYNPILARYLCFPSVPESHNPSCWDRPVNLVFDDSVLTPVWQTTPESTKTYKSFQDGLSFMIGWLIEAYNPGFCTTGLNLGLEQWSWGQSSGAISIIEFVLRVNSTRYTEHNTKINIEGPQ